MTELTPLCLLARRFETDKGGYHLRYGGGDSDTCHNYTPIYHLIYGKDRENVRHVFEIGINAGSSLRMWREYFPRATIVGIDSNAACLVHGDDRIACYAADQNNASSLLGVIGKLTPTSPLFDLIVDDGSHELEHQITSLKTLLPFLANQGCYVVEDIGGGERAMNSVRELCKVIPEDGYTATCYHCYEGLGKAVGPEILFVVSKNMRALP